MRNELVYKDESFIIVGLLFKVHNELGRYCNEKQCSDLFEQLLINNKIPYEREKQLPESFKGERSRRNIIDFIVYNKIIVEIKCKRYLTKNDYYQVQRYLSAYNVKLGLLVNFRDPRLNVKRILNSQSKISSIGN